MSDAPSVPGACPHAMATIVFSRTGTRLRPIIAAVEKCLDCGKELDRKKVNRGFDVYSRRGPE